MYDRVRNKEIYVEMTAFFNFEEEHISQEVILYNYLTLMEFYVLFPKMYVKPELLNYTV